MNDDVAKTDLSKTPATIALLRQRQEQERALPVTASFFDAQGYELMQRVAKAFAASSLVPREYVGNLPNCIIAINMAQRMGADPLMVMQNLYLVDGRPAWSSQFLIATFNQNGRFSSIRYEFFGRQGQDEWGCRAWAIEKETGLKIVGADITIALAKKEGWYGKKGSKWASMPQQMLMYRSASWMVRAYAPEIAMGLQTADEIRDTFDAERGADGSYSVQSTDLLRKPATNGKPAEVAKDKPTQEVKVVDTQTGELFTADEAEAIRQREIAEARNEGKEAS